MADFDLKRLARLGAEVRVRQLQLELAAIYKVFPDLRSSGPGYTGDEQTVHPAGKRRRRRTMGRAERKAVSLRMKRYWAARRKAKA